MATRPLPYRLAAIDLDETLLGPDKVVSAANLRAVRQLQSLGVQVVLASGRRHRNMERFHERLGLQGYIISAQGAMVKHAETGTVLHSAGVNAGLAQEIMAEGRDRGLAVIAYHEPAVYGNGPAEHLSHYSLLASEPVETRDLETLHDEVPEKLIWIGHPADIEWMATDVRERYSGRADTVITEPAFLEFTAHGVSKASALAALGHHLQIDRREILAFGDGNNDVAMLRWAGLGVAMSHAKPSAKAAAKLVASDGDAETSFARAVAEIMRQPSLCGAER